MSFFTDKLKELPFYLTRPSPCPYLDGQVEQKVFTRLLGDKKDDFLLQSQLTPFGFRRSQNIMYRPACPACMACVPVRMVMKDFALTPRLKRIQRRNRDLTTHIVSTENAPDFFELFARYQSARHAESDMATMNRQEFVSMMQEGGENAALLTLQNAEGVTLAAMLIDRLVHGTSAVYSFFAPEEERRSLGTALILRLVEETIGNALDNVYLGYWIKNCAKMSYKSNFPALERLGANGWETLKEDD